MWADLCEVCRKAFRSAYGQRRSQIWAECRRDYKVGRKAPVPMRHTTVSLEDLRSTAPPSDSAVSDRHPRDGEGTSRGTRSRVVADRYRYAVENELTEILTQLQEGDEWTAAVQQCGTLTGLPWRQYVALRREHLAERACQEPITERQPMDPVEELLQNIEAALTECRAYRLGQEMGINTQPNLLAFINRLLEYVGCDTLTTGVEAMIAKVSHLHPSIPLTAKPWRPTSSRFARQDASADATKAGLHQVMQASSYQGFALQIRRPALQIRRSALQVR